MKKKKLISSLITFILLTVWLLSGWPPIWQNPRIPPKIQEAQANTDTQYASSNSADGTLTGWTNPTYVYSDDGTNFATRAGTNKNEWYGTLYGFDLSGIPDNSTINSVTIAAEWKNSGNDSSGPVLYLGAKSGGAEVGTATTDTSGTTSFEVVTKVPTGLTTANLKTTGANGFWAILRFRRTDNTTHTASVDYVNVVVDYTPPAVDTPAYDNGTATYNNDVSVAISVASPASSVICYTTDGSTPAATTPGTCSTGTTYSGVVSITATGTVLKAIGTKVGYLNSAVQSATYTLTVGAITSSPGAGTYVGTQSVTLSVATTTSAVAHYTTDGSAVSCSSTTYSGAFNVSATTTVKAIGCKTNYNSDTAISDLYTIAIISVTITPAGDISYGIIEAGQSKSTIDLSATKTSTNDGDTTENLNIKTSNATGGTGWTLGSSADTNVFVHEFSTNGGGAWTKFTTVDSYQTLATGIAVSGTQNFDLKITVPTNSDSIEKTITVTVQAVAQ